MSKFKLSGFADEISSNVIEQFEAFNKLEINFFEPRGINGKNISELKDDEVVQLKETMEKYNIKSSSIGSPIGKIKISDDFKQHFELFKRVVKTAKMLDTRYIRMFSFYADGEEWTDEQKTEVFARLKQLIAYAKENDVVLLHENEKDIYGDTVERCLELMETLYCDNFKAVFDPANFVQCNEDTKIAFEKLEKYVEYLHIKDSRLSDGAVVPAGKGDGNIEFILRKLFAKEYSGFISLEPHLGTFEGLAALEVDDKMLKLPKGGLGTFTLARDSLLEIINKI
ncbi:MAG: sugar phosphate isomerase/epimerase [Ruminococcaceae bacterium]|nr:sugar phosphate isomerase/epimerase [Oscillospiraceae bacterium]